MKDSCLVHKEGGSLGQSQRNQYSWAYPGKFYGIQRADARMAVTELRLIQEQQELLHVKKSNQVFDFFPFVSHTLCDQVSQLPQIDVQDGKSGK